MEAIVVLTINVRPGHRGSEQQEADLTDVMSDDPLMKQVMSSNRG